ncbi:hypothetical protein [Rufibacter sp. LB8]|uniref:hypothetical protein n=1 Tax=Rufibacter sp. LB8 TaxID=2777781 RepID=UPI00178C483E|nr:hypothetical protein [Rufibacter sp. LB8]
MKRKELKKANGDVYFEAERSPDNSFIYVNWIGIQSLETIVLGGGLLLAMLKEKPCVAILNSNHELIGPWEEGVPYLAYKWAPAARDLGVVYFAHVLSPGIFGKRSFELFKKQVQELLHVRSFETKETASEWLSLHMV